MACFQPLLAVDNGIDSETGKHRINFLNMSRYGSLERVRDIFGDKLMMLPCGHCVACAQDYARMWQARIVAESQYYEKKCFVTLTYREERAPNKEDFRSFIDRLQKRFGEDGKRLKDLKFFACGELGEHTKRFHMHAILFGVDFAEDRKVISKRGLNYIYTSKTLDECWRHGYCSFGDVDVASAGYVSKYCDKKKISSLDSGEFIMMSRGLGKRYFEEHKYELFDSDYIYFAGNKFKLPRYFINLARKDDFLLMLDADVYCERKQKVAQSFRYDKCRSFVLEDEARLEASRCALDKKLNHEGVRDVL